MRKYWRELIILCTGAVAAVLFFALQDWAGPMILVDKYTPLFIGMALVSVGVLVSVLRRYRAEDREKAAKKQREEEVE